MNNPNLCETFRGTGTSLQFLPRQSQLPVENQAFDARTVGVGQVGELRHQDTATFALVTAIWPASVRSGFQLGTGKRGSCGSGVKWRRFWIEG
jgi:hypothetical protein